jgi:uncharacterized DUF497 family protein
MFEFDTNKSNVNKEKHGIDFNEAKEPWKDTNRLVIPARWVDEIRFLMIAEYNDIVWAVIYTYRKKKTRIISVRKARNHEKEIYLRG